MAAGAGRGRTPKPTALRALPGGNAGKLGLSGAVNPPLLTPENADRWRDELLSHPLEKTLWNLYVEEGRAAKLLAGMDGPMLAALCIEQAVYFTAAREVSSHAAKGHWGKLVAEKGGAYTGALAVGNKAFEKVMSLSAQFGGMPGSRAKLAALDTQMTLDGFDIEPEEMSDEELDAALADAASNVVSILKGGKAAG